MSTRPISTKAKAASQPDPEPTAAEFGVVAKPPQQGRSRASLERMLDAAEALMVQRGSGDFTLTEVSRVGRVSIGSIYNRFASKDELLHAVHARTMTRMELDHAKIPIRARGRARPGIGLIRALLDDLGEHLRAYAPIMRPLMMTAASDAIVRERGRVGYERMVEVVSAEMLTQREHIKRSDPEVAVLFVIKIAYSAYARELGFGMAELIEDSVDWGSLKREIGAMASAYLFCELTIPLD